MLTDPRGPVSFTGMEVHMFRRSLMTMLAAGFAFALVAPAVRADDAPADAPKDAPKVDNPEYKAWAKFKPDTTVTREMTVTGGPGGQAMTMTSTSKLVSVDADKAVVSNQMSMMGHDMPAKDQDVLAKDVDKKMGDPTGTEDVKIGDKTYSCKVYEITGAPPGVPAAQAKAMADSKTKIWVSDEVPGGMAKLTSEFKHGDTPMTITMTVTSFDAK
jgi:hypothetical protein